MTRGLRSCLYDRQYMITSPVIHKKLSWKSQRQLFHHYSVLHCGVLMINAGTQLAVALPFL